MTKTVEYCTFITICFARGDLLGVKYEIHRDDVYYSPTFQYFSGEESITVGELESVEERSVIRKQTKWFQEQGYFIHGMFEDNRNNILKVVLRKMWRENQEMFEKTPNFFDVKE